MLRPPAGGGGGLEGGGGGSSNGNVSGHHPGNRPEIIIEPSSLPPNGPSPMGIEAPPRVRPRTPSGPLPPPRRNTNASSDTANGGPRTPIVSISLSLRQPLIATGPLPKSLTSPTTPGITPGSDTGQTSIGVITPATQPTSPFPAAATPTAAQPAERKRVIRKVPKVPEKAEKVLYCMTLKNPLRKICINIVEWKYPLAHMDSHKLSCFCSSFCPLF